MSCPNLAPRGASGARAGTRRRIFGALAILCVIFAFGTAGCVTAEETDENGTANADASDATGATDEEVSALPDGGDPSPDPASPDATDPGPDPPDATGGGDGGTDPDPRPIPGEPCDTSEDTDWRCSDGTEVPWCTCEGGSFVCIRTPQTACPRGACDDETEAICAMLPPACPSGQIVAVQGGCYECVDPGTCTPVEAVETPCEHISECPRGSYCDECGTSSCPACDDCIAICLPYATACDDDSTLVCRALRPTCGEGEVSAVIQGCWACLDERTCEPASTTTTLCSSDSDCSIGAYCDECGTSSCPECRDCIATCVPYDEPCDDGSTLICRALRPNCPDGQISAVIDGCWACVNASTCEDPTSPATECESDSDCPIAHACVVCDGPGCRDCDDACDPGCQPHARPCDDGSALTCRMLRPTCLAGQISSVIDGCWECLYPATCTSRPTRPPARD